jgi:hypothetical protein
MQFKVPQDVQRADTIIGPLTWKQLIILAAGGGVCYAIYVGLAKDYFMEVWLPPIIVVGGLTAALAFLKIHDLTFERFLLCFLEYHLLPRKRIWKKGQAEPFVSFIQRKAEDEKLKKAQEVKKEQKSQKSIKEMSKILDTYSSGLEETADIATEKAQKKENLEKIINHKA